MSRDIDSGMLQYAPKGAYYEEKDQQFKAVKNMWDGLFDYDRALFALISILNGTGFSKGAMTHKLLSNPVKTTLDGRDLAVPDGLGSDFESKIITFNLCKLADKQMARALRNLLMLAGGELHSRVNNSRTRKVILEFIFNRDCRELDSLAINFKTKLAKLVRHSLGKQDLFKVLNGNMELFSKKIGRYNHLAFPVLCHLFNQIPIGLGSIRGHFPKIDDYWKAKSAAQLGNIEEFEKLIIKLPWRVAMGFRNSYKLDLDKSKIMGEAKMSNKEELVMEAAVKRSGAKARKVNYKAQDIYDLMKAFYFKFANEDIENVDEIGDVIDEKTAKMSKLNFGDGCAVVLDASHSMRGSEKRPMHPFLTSLCIVAAIENIESIFTIGGKWQSLEGTNKRVIWPSGASPLWRGLVDAVLSDAKNIILISDGYENSIKGMFNTVYKHFKNTGHEFNLIHINPVFSAESKSGTARSLAEDVKPMPITSYKYLETEFIFNQLLDNTEAVKQLLVHKYQKLIGGS